MAVGLDNFGRLTEEILPTSIGIITPPSKLEYIEGESIQFSGLVVQAYTADGNVWTDRNHPNGIIPIVELFFPVTVAEFNYDEGEGDYTNHNGLNATKIAFTKGVYFNGAGNFYTGPAIGAVPENTDGWPDGSTLYAASTTQGSVYFTTYNGTLYARGDGIDGYTAVVAPDNDNPFNMPWGYTGPFNSDKWSVVVRSSLANISAPESTVDPNTADEELDLEEQEQQVPVQWFRPGDGQMLETSFTIKVKAKKGGGSSGGGSSQAITYNGTRYVANEDMNAEAHYQSGTVWIRGEAKVWSVPDAVAFGLLKPEEEKDGGSDSGSEHEGGHF
jgi:hypothetical protein